jgi:hypothetical protein
MAGWHQTPTMSRPPSPLPSPPPKPHTDACIFHNVCFPPQTFHLGPNYLEVDLDVHNYAFLARKALWSYHDRLPTVVWDMGFVIQVRHH